MTQAIFQYDTDLLARFPATIGGIIVGRGLRNGETPEPLAEAYRAEQQITLERIGETPLSEIPSLAAWRQTFRQFDVNPTKYRSAPEALLRRLTKSGDIPSINALVDIGNLVSIRYALPVAVFDTRAVRRPVTVHLADGSERYRELGSEETVQPEVGEVIFSDATDMVLARRWCWRQSAESAAHRDTTDILIAVEAQHEQGQHDVQAAVDDLLALLEEHTGGENLWTLLDAAAPALREL